MEMEDKKVNLKVDIVYLWVNGNDPEWRSKHDRFVGSDNNDTSMNCEGRYVNNDELKYSLRSLDMYAPWINRVFIVTDNQIPQWLDISNPKVRIVDHKEILPDEVLPTFNSRVIEHRLHLIPGLSEYFLYANDDMFFNREVRTTDFFTEDGIPIVRLSRRPFRKLTLFLKENLLGKPLSNYNKTIQTSAKMVEREYGIYIGHKTHHNIDAYKKSDYQHTYEVFKKEIEPTLKNRKRSGNDVQRNIYTYVPIAEKKAKINFVSNKTSFRFQIEKQHYYKKLEDYNPLLFCMNDSEYADNDARNRMAEFLKTRFPNKSQFEK